MLNACVKCVSGNFADAGASFNHCFDASCKMQVAAKVFLKNEESRNRCEETCLKVKGFLPMQNAVKKKYCGYCNNGVSPDFLALQSEGCNWTNTSIIGTKFYNNGRAAGCVAFIKGLMDNLKSMCRGCKTEKSEIDPIAIHWAMVDKENRNKSYISFL